MVHVDTAGALRNETLEHIPAEFLPLADGVNWLGVGARPVVRRVVHRAFSARPRWPGCRSVASCTLSCTVTLPRLFACLGKAQGC